MCKRPLRPSATWGTYIRGLDHPRRHSPELGPKEPHNKGVIDGDPHNKLLVYLGVGNGASCEKCSVHLDKFDDDDLMKNNNVEVSQTLSRVI